MEENEKIILGQNKAKENNIPEQYIDNEFKVPTEEVTLPSRGVFYPGQKSTVKIKYLTAEEDNILFSTDLIKSGKVLDVLLEQAVLDKELVVLVRRIINQLLTCQN